MVYKSLEEIGEDLPDHSPRFVLLSYPLTLVRASPLRPRPSYPYPSDPVSRTTQTHSTVSLASPRAVVLLHHMFPSISFPPPSDTLNQAHGGAAARDALRLELTTFDK